MTDTGQEGLGTRLSTSYLVSRSITPVCSGHAGLYKAYPTEMHFSIAMCDTESDPRWGWLGIWLARLGPCMTSTASHSAMNLQRSACTRGDIIH